MEGCSKAMRAWVLIGMVLLASLACTLSRSDDDAEPTVVGRTATPQRIDDTARTATAQTIGQRPTIQTTTTSSVPATQAPTLIPTPVQFVPPTSAGSISSGGNAPPVSSGGGVGNVTFNGASGGAPTNGAGFYFPAAIVYSSGGQLFNTSPSGGGQAMGGSGRAVRSWNGLYVTYLGNGMEVRRPDGVTVTFSAPGATTLPSWSTDGNSFVYAQGSQIVLYQNGAASVIGDISGNAIATEFAPDGSGAILFASQTQVKLYRGAGAVFTLIDTPNDPIVDGPFWSTRGRQWGIYVRLSSGRRIWFDMGGAANEITDEFERLHLASPVDNDLGRVVIIRDEGTLTVLARWPNLPEREFQTPSLADVSWSPDSAQLVYVNTAGELIFLDIASGEQRMIASGGVRYPMWSAPRYVVGR